MEVKQMVDGQHLEHLQNVRRVVALPPKASGLHWHPFGVYTIPMGKRRDGEATWSRRLHIWHPKAQPVGEGSDYGVHTHSGPAVSHVLVGSLRHHLYEFAATDGPWLRQPGDQRASLLVHASAVTEAGMQHDLPKDTPHSVGLADGFAISLFEQKDGPVDMPFTTWRRTDVPYEPRRVTGPVGLDSVATMARQAIDERLYAFGL